MLLGMIRRKWRLWKAERKWKAAKRWVAHWESVGGNIPTGWGAKKPKDAIDTNAQ